MCSTGGRKDRRPLIQQCGDVIEAHVRRTVFGLAPGGINISREEATYLTSPTLPALPALPLYLPRLLTGQVTVRTQLTEDPGMQR